MTDRVRLDIDGAIATITNNNPAKHNAFDDEMDVRLFEILEELAGRPEVRAVVWRAEGRSWSSGRDLSVVGTNLSELTHHELMVRGHKGIQRPVGAGRSGDRSHTGVGHRRVVPAGPAVRHPHRGRRAPASGCPRWATASSPTPAG